MKVKTEYFQPASISKKYQIWDGVTNGKLMAQFYTQQLICLHPLSIYWSVYAGLIFKLAIGCPEETIFNSSYEVSVAIVLQENWCICCQVKENFLKIFTVLYYTSLGLEWGIVINQVMITIQ